MTRLGRWLAAVGVAAVAVVGGSAQVPAPRPRITGIDHLVIRVSDAAAAKRFYGGVLGLAETSNPAEGPASRLRFDVGSRQTIRVAADLPAGEDERLSLLTFATPDLQRLAAHLRDKGISTIWMSGGVVVTDPDGHAVGFVERAWPPEAGAAAGTAQGPRPVSTRILHAGLTIRDEAAANRFYKDVLGFSEIWRGGRTDGATDWINMRVPDGTDYLEYMLVTSPPDRRQRGVLHHVALEVPDVQAAWEAVSARTPEAERARLGPPNVGRNGRWQLNLYDGDGTRTELMEPFTVR